MIFSYPRRLCSFFLLAIGTGMGIHLPPPLFIVFLIYAECNDHGRHVFIVVRNAGPDVTDVATRCC